MGAASILHCDECEHAEVEVKQPQPVWRWHVLALATVVQIGNSLPQQTPAAIGPILITALALSKAQLGLLTAAIWGGMLFGLFPSGLLVDRLGERVMVPVSSVALGTLVFVASFLSSFNVLFVVLTLAAATGASTGVSGARAVSGWFSRRQRGLALGIRQTGVTLAGIVAGVALPTVALAHGWRDAFRIVGVTVVATGMLFAALYREPPERQAHGGDINLWALVKDRGFLLSSLFAWMYMGAMGVAIAYLPVSFHEATRVPVVQATVLLAFLQLGGVIGRVAWGALSDVLGDRGRVMAMCSGLGIAAAVAMAATPAAAPTAWPMLAGVATILGIATAGWNGLYIAVATDLAPTKPAALIGAGSTFTFTGLFVVTPCFGLLVDAAHSYTLAWLALAVWSLFAAAVALRVPVSSADQPAAA